jgi:hypothetical protein
VFRYLGTTLTNQNSINEETKKKKTDSSQGMFAVIWCRIFCLPVCYPKINIKIHKTVILPAALHGCVTWSFMWRAECRLRVFENRLLRRIFGSKRDEVTGEWRRLMLCNSQQIQGGSNMTGTDLCVNKPHLSRSYLNHLVSFKGSNKKEQDGRACGKEGGRGKVHIKFW